MNARSARTEKKRAQVREEILAAAATALAEEGLPGLTLDAVATRLGVTKPALYYYFASKDALLGDLLVDLAERLATRLLEAVEAAPTGVAAVTALVDAVDAHFKDRLADFRAQFLWSQVVPTDPTVVHERINPRMVAVFSRLEARLEEDRRRGRLHEGVYPRRLAMVAWMSAFGLVSVRALFDASATSSLHSFDDLRIELSAVLERGVTPDGGPA